MLIELTGSQNSIEYVTRSSATLVKNRIGCPEKASNLIGFNSEIELREGLVKLIEWRAQHKAEVDRRRSALRVEN